MFDDTQVIANIDAALRRDADAIRAAQARKDSRAVTQVLKDVDRLLDTRLSIHAHQPANA